MQAAKYILTLSVSSKKMDTLPFEGIPALTITFLENYGFHSTGETAVILDPPVLYA